MSSLQQQKETTPPPQQSREKTPEKTMLPPSIPRRSSAKATSPIRNLAKRSSSEREETLVSPLTAPSEKQQPNELFSKNIFDSPPPKRPCEPRPGHAEDSPASPLTVRSERQPPQELGGWILFDSPRPERACTPRPGQGEETPVNPLTVPSSERQQPQEFFPKSLLTPPSLQCPSSPRPRHQTLSTIQTEAHSSSRAKHHSTDSSSSIDRRSSTFSYPPLIGSSYSRGTSSLDTTVTRFRPASLDSPYKVTKTMLKDANDNLFTNRRPRDALGVYSLILMVHSPGHPYALFCRALCHLALGAPELACVDATRAIIGVKLATTELNEEHVRVTGFEPETAWDGKGKGKGKDTTETKVEAEAVADAKKRPFAEMVLEGFHVSEEGAYLGEWWTKEFLRYAKGPDERNPDLNSNVESDEEMEEPSGDSTRQESNRAIEHTPARRGVPESKYVPWLNNELASPVVDPEARGNLREVCVEMRLKAGYVLAYSFWACGGGAVHNCLNVITEISQKTSMSQKKRKLFNDLLEGASLVVEDVACCMDQAATKPDHDHETLRKGAEDVLKSRWTSFDRKSFMSFIHDDLRITLTSVAKDCQSLAPDLKMVAKVAGLSDDGVRARTLVAKEDMLDGALIASDEAVLSAITASSELSRADVYCEQCAARLRIPDQVCQILSLKSACSADSPEGTPRHKTPGVASTSACTHYGDLVSCVSTTDLVWCSQACYEAYVEIGCSHDFPEVRMEALLKIMNEQSREGRALGVPSGKLQFLHSVLLGKILTGSSRSRATWLSWAATTQAYSSWTNSDGLDSCSLTRTNIPWSYTFNVLVPFTFLSNGPAPNRELAEYGTGQDGWQINLLAEFVQKHCRITKFVRTSKRFDEEGRQTLAVNMAGDVEDDIWCATLHPLVSQCARAPRNRPDLVNAELVDVGMTLEVRARLPESRNNPLAKCERSEGWVNVLSSFNSEDDIMTDMASASQNPSEIAIRKYDRIILPAPPADDQTTVNVDSLARLRTQYPELFGTPRAGQPSSSASGSASAIGLSTADHIDYQLARQLIRKAPGTLRTGLVVKATERLMERQKFSWLWMGLMVESGDVWDEEVDDTDEALRDLLED